jgi:hypothetical protein
VKACPTGCLQFGTKEDMVALGEQRVATLKASGQPQATLYDPPGVGGTTVVTVLAHGDHPEWYGLPADPKIPASVWLSRKLLRPILKLFFNPDKITSVLHIQAQVNSQSEQRLRRNL